MKKRQAYLITAYKDFDAVYELASFLCREDYVYLHIDKKSKEIGEREIERLRELKHVKVISDYSVPWGGFTHVQAFLRLMKLAAANPDVSYLHFLTGEDFPVRSPKEIHDRFVDCDKIYLDYVEQKDFPPQVEKRYRYYNWFQNKNVKNPVLWQVQNLTVNCQKLVGIRRKKLGEFSDIYKGLLYISLPGDCAKDILSYVSEHPEYVKALYRTQIPEEFFFHTILLNDSFANGKYKDRIEKRELRYLNWERGDGGSPAYLLEEDLPLLKKGRYYFARKFHSHDALREQIVKDMWNL
ncbi:MAG: beta-1,6-N-acetylglucosaminyltransferase [Lachnospiraceae bacterium]|nr:beta-1,6-N-acetylglucosaminyltransferase [Lachnospiraceae bacterium]